ncbi:50S ribosomal protein L18 [Geitlerinema sp. PCC 9228]|uniref:50S ribosomal protein L18 n=1 Tax=Geitlerinema sp. PCC 9228 TaxID=111611 RepID=UPI0008F99357|nr:50S ribosomal protein L18 [Geitlerinema sp. PCC 9228]
MKRTRKEQIKRRHDRVRKRVFGTPERPRLCVFRSNQHIYVQAIDDTQHHTIVAASTLDKDLRSQLSSTATCEAAASVGKLVAQRALEKGVQKVVFDRGGNVYHGRVAALAEGAREGGLNF